MGRTIDEHSSFDEVKSFSDTLSQWVHIYLTHYSDTWADPGQQIIPQDCKIFRTPH